MNDEDLKLTDVFTPISYREQWVKPFLRAYKMLLTHSSEKDIETLCDMIRFDFKQFNGDLK